MGHWKHTISVILFFTTCLAVFLFSLQINWNGGGFKNVDPQKEIMSSLQETYFQNIFYYVLKEQRPYFFLDAKEVTYQNTQNKAYYFSPRGEVITSKGEVVEYSGERGIYQERTGEVTLNDEAALSMVDRLATGDHMIFNLNTNVTVITGNVKTKTYRPEEGDWIYLDSDQATIWLNKKHSQHKGNVKGKIQRKRIYEDSLSFESQYLYLDMIENKADLKTDVFIKKQNLRATSRRGEIFLENYNKKLKYYALYDDVKVVEKVQLEGKWIERKAFSEKLEGIPSEEKIVLTGYPKVYQLRDVIKGNVITLRENTEVVEVDDANTKFKLEE